MNEHKALFANTRFVALRVCDAIKIYRKVAAKYVCARVCMYICVLNVEQVCMYRSLSFRLNGSDRNGYYLKSSCIYIRHCQTYTCTLYVQSVPE